MEHREGGDEGGIPEVVVELPQLRAAKQRLVDQGPVAQRRDVEPFSVPFAREGLDLTAGQALANLLATSCGGARYDSVPDQVIQYVLGTFGKPTAPVDAWVLDHVMARPRAAELSAEPPPLSVAELRARFGSRVPDEELLP